MRRNRRTPPKPPGEPVAEWREVRVDVAALLGELWMVWTSWEKMATTLRWLRFEAIAASVAIRGAGSSCALSKTIDLTATGNPRHSPAQHVFSISLVSFISIISTLVACAHTAEGKEPEGLNVTVRIDIDRQEIRAFVQQFAFLSAIKYLQAQITRSRDACVRFLPAAWQRRKYKDVNHKHTWTRNAQSRKGRKFRCGGKCESVVGLQCHI
jgi:hypothetical protein